jgi:hypothetical protein
MGVIGNLYSQTMIVALMKLNGLIVPQYCRFLGFPKFRSPSYVNRRVEA